MKTGFKYQTTKLHDLLSRLRELHLLQVKYPRAPAFQCSKLTDLEINALYGLIHGMEHLYLCHHTRIFPVRAHSL